MLGLFRAARQGARMIGRLITITAMVLAAQLVIACNTQSTATDAKVADLEKRLAETEKQLADARQAQSPPPAQPVEAAPPPAPTATAGSKPAAPAKPPTTAPATKLTRPTEPPLSQKYMTAAQAEREKAELQRIVDEQRAVNKAQAESNLKLQEQVDRLKPREFTLVEGTVVPVRTTAELSTARLANGSTFDGL